MRKRRIVSSKNMKEVLDYHNGRTYKNKSKRRQKMNATPDAIKSRMKKWQNLNYA